MSANLLDTEAAVRSLVDDIQSRAPEKSLIFVDLEGVDLSRYGSIAVMQIFIPSSHLLQRG